MSSHLKPVWNQGIEALDATEEVKRMVARRAKKVMVMLAVLGLVPNATAQHLNGLQRASACLPQHPVGARDIPWRDRYSLRFRSGGSTIPWRTGGRPLRQGLARRLAAVSLSAVDLLFA